MPNFTLARLASAGLASLAMAAAPVFADPLEPPVAAKIPHAVVSANGTREDDYYCCGTIRAPPVPSSTTSHGKIPIATR